MESQPDRAADRKVFQALREKLRRSGHAFVIFKTKTLMKSVRMEYKGFWMEESFAPVSNEEVNDLIEA